MIVTNQKFELSYYGRHARRADSRFRRKMILEATLRLIVKEGMRGIHHRSVACEAEVPLAATTYYFKNLNDLISDSFTYFVEGNLEQIHRLQGGSFVVTPNAEGGRKQLIQQFIDFMLAYIRTFSSNRNNLLIELAFRNEALHNPQLVPVVRLANQLTERFIREFFDLLQLPDPCTAAQILHGTILNLEFQVLCGVMALSSPSLDSTIKLLIHGLLHGSHPDENSDEQSFALGQYSV
ncbi:MAG: TetR/AcrR family transcriptional regulator [Gammaproteobacteria bacterium]|nr:TetR/AcrR family transcriptional regulator [Gammaproteobacteria bacterium]